MTFKIHCIDEPLLRFAYQQCIFDPRDGLTLFGPYTRESIRYASFGIIGTQAGRNRMINWLKTIRKPVASNEDDIARPYFPGLEAAFNFDIQTESIEQIDISAEGINTYLKYSDSHQRVFNLVNLFADALIKYKKEEERPVLVWFVVIPDDIYKYCRPKSSIPKLPDSIKVGLKSKSRFIPLLFNEMSELQDAYKYEKNFHNQLKAKLLEHGIVIQIVKESTVAYGDFLNRKGEPIRDLKKFESAIAWNISTTLYYKIGGLPWKLGKIREGICYIGLVYKKMETRQDEKTACCAAQMFLDSGDGLVFKGNVGPWYNPENKDFHLSKESAYELIEKTLNTFLQKNGEYPKELFIHAKTYFDEDEWAGFSEAAKDKSEIIGVRIRSENIFKLYRQYAYPVPRGLTVVVGRRNAYLWTKGFIPRIQTIMGLETPNPLSIEILRGNANITQVCEDVLGLTKLNYNTCIYGDGVPVTLRFADAVGEILTAGPMEDIGVLPFKHYI
jgi:hypothetical protein